MKKKKIESQFLSDTKYEGRNDMYVDVDRMINEGMSGGTVIMHADYANIDEAIDFHPEDPPQGYE